MVRCFLATCGCVLALALSAPVPAVAQSRPLPVRLSWEAPRECGSGDQVLVVASQQLSRTPLPAELQLIVRAQVRLLGARSYEIDVTWEAQLRDTEGATLRSTRSLRAGDCDAIVRAAANILAEALRSGGEPSADRVTAVRQRNRRAGSRRASGGNGEFAAGTTAPLPYGRYAPPSGYRAAGDASDRVDALTADRTGSESGWRLGASALADIGTFPFFAPGLQAVVAKPLGVLELRVDGWLFPSQASPVRSHPSAAVSMGSAGAKAALCVPALGSTPSVALGPCTGFEVGRLWAETTGITEPGSATADWFAWSLSGLARIALSSSVDALLMMEALLPTHASSFVVDGLGEVHRPRDVTVRGSAGIELALP